MGRLASMPKSRARCRASASVSVKLPGSMNASMRSRAVRCPLAWRFSSAASVPGCSDWSTRLRSSASLPAVVWMSGPASGTASAVTSRGYPGRSGTLRTVYDDLDRPPLRAAPLARVLSPDGWRVEVLDTTPSTNQVVADRARAGEPAGLGVVAEQQTAGRGRLDRVWLSPARAGLTFSVLLRPALPATDWGWVPLLAGLAVARALRARAELDATVKWPNDVLVGERKVCGILAEVPAPGAVVVGIGLNVTTRRDELPVETATSLQLEGAATTDRDTLLRAVLRELTEVMVQPSARDD